MIVYAVEKWRENIVCAVEKWREYYFFYAVDKWRKNDCLCR